MKKSTSLQFIRENQPDMDSPTSDFSKKVREDLIKKGFFSPIDIADNNASRKPLTPISTTSTPSLT